MKSHPPPTLTSSISELYPLNMEWKPFQNKLSSIMLSLLVVSTIFALFTLRSSTPFSIVHTKNIEGVLNQTHPLLQNNTSISTRNILNPDKSSAIAAPQTLEESTTSEGNESIPNKNGTTTTPIQSIVKPECDLFIGKWVRDESGPIYTNTSCRTLPDMRNCAKYGKDQGYVYWRWKPDGCELPRFDPTLFLKIVRGKKLMFIGDSLARNMMESLLCLLSQAEIPIATYKDEKDKHRTWYFPSHDFTLMVIWTEFLVDGAEIINNGVPSNTFDIHIDRMHPMWAKKLPELSYAIINGGNWFTRKTFVHRRGKLIGCVHCVGENIPSISVPSGVRMVFKAAFKYIRKCKECGDLLTLLRTYSMSHFEHGSWLNGGYCNRTQPLKEEEVSLRGGPWEYRKIQMEELENVKKLGKKKFGILDVTKAMILRADAHPGKHWIAKQTNDCLHWCLPGAIDMWSELLLEVMKRST